MSQNVSIDFHSFTIFAEPMDLHFRQPQPHIFMKISNFRSILFFCGPEMEVHWSREESKWIKIVRNVYRYEHNTIIIDYNQFKYQ